MEHHDAIHHCNSLNSPIHKLDARIKILVTLCYILCVVSLPPHAVTGFAVFGGLLLWGIAASLLSLRLILKRGAVVLPFSALIAIGLPFFHEGPSLYVAGLSLSKVGLWLFFGASAKAFLCATIIVLLIATTRFSQIMESMKALGVPRLFIDMLALTYRYIFVLSEETSRLRRAAIARGYKPKWLPQSIIVGKLIGALFLRSYERAERVYDAMKLRGYRGELPEQGIPALSIFQIAATGVCLLLLILTRLIAT